MATDTKEAPLLIEKEEKMIAFLKANKHLLDESSINDAIIEYTDLSRSIEKSKQDGRTLEIGIIGAVKAGKSSFLNALLFDGEDILPKAATPMTAALTRISYKEEPAAVIHFYNEEDWERVHSLAAEYDRLLNQEYDKYSKDIDKQIKDVDHYNTAVRDLLREKPRPRPQKLVLKDYELNIFKSKVSESIRSSKELSVMVTDDSILEQLGKQTEVPYSQINKYVGSNGVYTPIVNYVDLFINNERLRDLVIVDTPGLYDPIESRAYVTKRYLRECDAVLLLSPTTEFMDANVMNEMVRTLPGNNVSEIVVIGSKLDSGILDYNAPDKVPIKKAFMDSVSKYKTRVRNNIASLSNEPSASKKLEGIQPLFVSALIHSVICKQKKGVALNREETNILNQLNRRFADCDDTALAQLSGINGVKKKLREILQKKESIFEEKNSGLLRTSRRHMTDILDSVEEGALSAVGKLENSDIASLQTRYKYLDTVLARSRQKIKSEFEMAANIAEKTAVGTQAHIRSDLSRYIKIKIETTTHQEHEPVSTGFLGLKKEIHTYNVTDYHATTDQVVGNIQSYIGACMAIIDQDFSTIVNANQLRKNVAKCVLDALHAGGGDYSEDDVVPKLNSVLSKIVIPSINIDATEYLDQVSSHFSAGVAKGQDIHKLSSLQADLMSSVMENMIKQTNDCVNEIRRLLDEQAVSFTDDIIVRLKSEGERIMEQMKDQKRFLGEYRKFVDEIRDMRMTLNEAVKG